MQPTAISNRHHYQDLVGTVKLAEKQVW